MQRFKLMWFVLFIALTYTGIASGQEVKSLSVSYFNEGVPQDYVDNFLTQLEANFAEQNISLEIQDDSADLNLRFSVVFDGEHIITGQLVNLSIKDSVVVDISPMLRHVERSVIEADAATSANYTTAMYLYTQGECSLATDYLDLLDSITYENNYIAFLYQGNCELSIGDYETAIESLVKAIPSNPDYVPYKEAITNLAWTYFQTGDLDTAIELTEEPIAAYTDWHEYGWVADLMAVRAQLYALAFDYDSAITDMDAAIELAEANDVSDEQLAELYTLRGEIIFLLYEWDRVLENFNTALELNPEYAPAYFQRGVLYYTMTERENALADFQHYLEIAPDGVHAAEAQRYIDSIQLELESLGG